MFKTKSIIAYRASEGEALPSFEKITAAVESKPLMPIAAHDEFTVGFVAPVSGGEQAVSVESLTVICFQKDSKVLTSSAIKKLLQEKVEKIEAREMRKLPSKERSRLKDEIIFDLLPNALVVSKKMYAVFDHNRGILFVCASSASAAEEVLSALRNALGSLAIVPFGATATRPQGVMTPWVEHGIDDDRFTLDDEVHLASAEQEGGIIRAKHQAIDSDEIRAHIKNGKQVEKLGLGFGDECYLLIDSNLNVKNLMLTDFVQEKKAMSDLSIELEMFQSDVLIEFDVIGRLYDAIGKNFGVPDYE